MAATSVDLTESRALEINLVAWLSTGLGIAAVFLKLFARAHIVKRVGWDDFFIFFSLALSIIAAAFVSYSVTLGLGRHTEAVLADYGMERLVNTGKWQILGFPFNIGAFSFPNISIAILLHNLLDPNPFRTRFLYVMVILQVFFAMISVVIIFAMCSPAEKLWNTSLPGTCWDSAVFLDFTYWVSAYTAVTDFILAVIPISVFWKLQMRFSTKLGVCIMMGLTLLSAIITIVKATYLPLFVDKTDPLYNVAPLVIWGLVEQNVVIVAACIPTLRPFFHKAFGSTTSVSGTGNSNSRRSSAFKLSSNPRRSTAKRLESTNAETLVDIEQQRSFDVDSNSSQRGIWQTREVHVESEHEGDSKEICDRKVRETVPESLRSPR